MDTLVDDHRHLLARTPELVGGKFAKMSGVYVDGSSSIYPYFRGTLSQMYRDLGGDFTLIIPTRYTSKQSVLTHLIGDPHLENVSTALGADGVLNLEWDDFDASGYGPWIWDLRRLALSFWVLSVELNHPEIIARLIEGVIEGYQNGVKLWSVGERVQPQEGTILPIYIRDLFAKAREKLNEQQLFVRYTRIHQGPDHQPIRSLARGEIRPNKQVGVIRDALFSLVENEKVLVAQIDTDLRIQNHQLGLLKDYARRFGQGVSSYPLMRFYLLYEGETTALDDDQIWEVKELGDRPAPPNLSLYPPRQFGAQGARVIQGRLALQWAQTLNPLGITSLTWIDVGSFSFRVRLKSDLQRGLNLADIVDRDQSLRSEDHEQADQELISLARLLGSLLAGAHCFAPSREGYPGGEIIMADLNREGWSPLFQETLDFVSTYGLVIRQDRRLLMTLLDRFGPSLGYRGGMYGTE